MAIPHINIAFTQHLTHSMFCGIPCCSGGYTMAYMAPPPISCIT